MKRSPVDKDYLLKQPFDPNISMIKILAPDSVIAHQVAASDGPIVNVSNGNICRIKHLGRSQANHNVPSYFWTKQCKKLNAIVTTAKSEVVNPRQNALSASFVESRLRHKACSRENNLKFKNAKGYVLKRCAEAAIHVRQNTKTPWTTPIVPDTFSSTDTHVRPAAMTKSI